MKYQMDCSFAILPDSASFTSPLQEASFKQSCEWYLHSAHMNLQESVIRLIPGSAPFPTFSFY